MTDKNISHPARRYLRAWALSGPLADMETGDPRRVRTAGITAASTPAQQTLDEHFVAGLTYGQAAARASSESNREELLDLGRPHLQALDAAGERDAAREAIAVIESAERVESFFASLGGPLQ